MPPSAIGTTYVMRPSPAHRRPVMVSLGVDVKGACLPHPDMSDTATMRAGAQTRFCRRPPVPNNATMNRFRTFVAGWLRSNLTPLPRDTDVSTDIWLENSNYPMWRRAQLARTAQEYVETGWTRKVPLVSMFIKDEQYSEYKHARCINSRSDEYKCIVGPYMKAIENVLYKRPEFIKHVPVADRPAYIRRHLEREGVNYVATDYTSFESLFTSEFMECCEMQLYEYMLEDLEGGHDIIDLIREVQLGTNSCHNKYLSIRVPGKRMSGEMNTSLGNGFANLMIMLFICQEIGARNVAGCVEGDDGLFSMEGPTPTEADFAQLGLIIKLEVHPNVNTASFCGMIFDTADNIIISDVMSHLTRFGWTSARYAGASDRVLLRLLRSKALSMLYSYPGCPVLWKLARYGLRVTQSVSADDLSKYNDTWWKRERAELDALVPFEVVWSREPTYASRLLVEEKYGLTVPDQIAIEKYLDGLTTICQLDHPVIDNYMHPDWGHYSSIYTVPVDVRGDTAEDAWTNMASFHPEYA